jgi:hypothetical protein
MSDGTAASDRESTRRVRLRRCVAVGVTALSFSAALSAPASATDYCVVPNAGCGGTNVGTLPEALDLADDDTGPDRIFLGAFKYVAPTTAGFDYSKTGAPVEIVGKGAGQTILTAPSGASNVLRLFGSAASSVHDLRIEIPANAAYDFNGLSTDGVAREIDVVEDKTQQYLRYGVHLENGGTLEDSSVGLSNAPNSTAIRTDVGGGTVRGSTVSAYVGVAAAHGATIERSRFLVAGVALAAGPGVTTVNTSVMHVFGQPGVGLLAQPLPGSGDVTINADGMTIVGPGHFGQRAALVSTYWAPAQNADINLKNSIIRGSKLEATAGGTGHARITVAYSDLDPIGNDLNGPPNASITLSNTSNVGDAGFADPQLLDYHLLPSSPLIDAGAPNTPAGTDLDGKPLVVDGDGDGTARRDMGAFEYQTSLPGAGDPPPPPPAGEPGGGAPLDTQAPLIGGFRATPSLFALGRAATPVSARVARGTRFRYTLSEAARVTVRIKRARPGRRSGGRCVAPSARLRRAQSCTRYIGVGTLRRSGAKGANRIRFTGRIGTRVLGPSRYRAVISATDAVGNRSTLSRTAFRIAAS